MTSAEYITLMMKELDSVSDTELATNAATWWTLNADQPSERLQYLYTKRQAIQYLMFQARKNIDITIGPDKLNASQVFKHLASLNDDVMDDIKFAESPRSTGTMKSAFPKVVQHE